MKQLAQLALIVTLALCATACVSPPAPKYQASVDNTGLLLKQDAKLAVGAFTAAAGVENHSLSIRGSQIKGGTDGTFSTYLRDAVITELQTAGRYDETSKLQLTGTLTGTRSAPDLPKPAPPRWVASSPWPRTVQWSSRRPSWRNTSGNRRSSVQWQFPPPSIITVRPCRSYWASCCQIPILLLRCGRGGGSGRCRCATNCLMFAMNGTSL